MQTGPATDFSTDAIAHLYRWDEIEGWRLLLEHFELVDDFTLIVVLAPDEWGVALVREQLKTVLLERGTFQRVRFDPAAGTDSLAEALLALAESPVDPGLPIVWIDADPAPPDELGQREQDWKRALARLNRYRNTLQASFAGTLVVALPSRFQQTFAATAPDLWSIRSGTFRIEPPGGSRNAIEMLPADERILLDQPNTTDSGDPAETLAQAEKLRGKPGREVLLARLLQRAGNQARSRLDWNTARRCLEEAYSLQDVIGHSDPELQWDIATDLARVFFYDTVQYARAEHYLRQAHEVAEERFGPEDTRTASSLNNLAQLLKATNRLAEAEPLMRRALAIDEQSHGAEHPYVAVDLSNLAALLKDANHLEEAEPLMRRALAIDEQSCGAEHPDVARDLNNLAQLLQATNRLAEAEPLMRRALAIDEQSCGAEHPEVAIDLNNLAQLLQATNRLAEAEPLMRRALAIDEQSYGAEHPNAARDLNNLAQLLQDTNRLAEAEPLMSRALAIDEQSYGAEHSKVATDLWNLAALLRDTDRLDEALPLMERSVVILRLFKSRNGIPHPSWDNVLRYYQSMRQQAGISDPQSYG